MKHPVMAITWAVASALLVTVSSGCSSSSNSSSGKTTTPTTAPTTAVTSAPATASSSTSATGSTIAVASSKYGPILVDGKGSTLYLFEADTSTKSTCTGTCAAAWPPVLTSGAPKAAKGAKAALLGTTKRSDGSTEVTYNGHPLYYYAGDTKPGDTTGQELSQFGAKWYVLNASGNKVEGD
ncbi:COG4315 family predicted lipoprotein [Streptomyces sp. NPDC054833]